MTAVLVPLLAHLGAASVALLAGVLFAETGLLVGFFLPGDSLLFASGVLTATGSIPLPVLLVAAAAVAAGVLGDQVAYLLGARYGVRLVGPEARRRRWLSTEHVEAARAFFERHGPRAVVLARFLPLVRTFTPLVAGTVGMPRGRFTAYNVGGGVAWVASLLAAGWYLGGVPLVAAHVDLVTVGLVTVSLVPAGVGLLRRRRRGTVAP